MTSKEYLMFQVMVEKLEAVAQNPRFTQDCRDTARGEAERMRASLALRRRA